jgi:hypothetical protein
MSSSVLTQTATMSQAAPSSAGVSWTTTGVLPRRSSDAGCRAQTQGEAVLGDRDGHRQPLGTQLDEPDVPAALPVRAHPGRQAPGLLRLS